MRSPPPEVRATWPKPNYVDPERRGNESVIVQSILVVLVTAIVIIRLYARIVITRAGIGLDDTLIIISWVRSNFSYFHEASARESFDEMYNERQS